MLDPHSTLSTAAQNSAEGRWGKLAAWLGVRWACPQERTLAELADGVLPESFRSRLELHLAQCDRCRALVADVIRMQRESEPDVPRREWIKQAEAYGRRGSVNWQSMRIPLAAVVTAAILAAAVVFFARKPQQVSQVSTPPRVKSYPAKVDPRPTAPPYTPPDIERKPVVREKLPTVLFPRVHSVLKDQKLRIRWRAMSGSPLYKVTLVTSNGDLVWEGQSETASLELPAEVTLNDGDYFVWIAATSKDGRVLKSDPVRFEIRR